MIKKFESIEAEFTEMQETGNPRGQDTGFKTLDDYLSIKQGSFLFVLAAPGHGKSEFGFEICFNQAMRYGKKSVIYSPETGGVADIYAEFIHKFTGRHIYKSLPGCVNEKEMYAAINYIDSHFSVIDSDVKSYTYKELFDLTTDESIIFSDPYNEVNHEMDKYNGRQDLYIEDIVGEIRRYCKREKKYCIQTLHPAFQKPQMINQQTYFLMPTAREAAGGQALLRKAMTWVNLWRPPTFLEVDGMPYEDNVLIVNIEKAKPKGVAKKGTVKIYFDWKRNRYYEQISGLKHYSFEHENKPKLHADAFIMPVSEVFNTKPDETNLF